jgi:plasmid stabilization system protein ParE
VKLVWSNLAKQELLSLKRYSVERWGTEVARRYLEDVRDAAKLVGDDPGRARILKGPYRIFRVRSHCLIVHLDPGAERISIARLLHAAMDIDRHLP